jgi:hypothetical protein
MMSYNGWTNKETWLVNVWYMSEMPGYFSDVWQVGVEPSELRDAIQYISEECEALSQLPAGLLSDFIQTCWAEVNWNELADHLNEKLADLGAE